MVRTRFAPSPTGPLHVGGARTALFNYLFAKKHRGSFILRIEDTDPERSKPEFELDIESSLSWLGITFDESPWVGGRYGPYRQSERLNLYDEAFSELKKRKLIYRCFCTDADLLRMKEEQIQKGQKIGYDRRCLKLSEPEIERLLKEKRKYAWRFLLPDKKVKFKDIIKGDIVIDLNSLSDFIVKKSDGYPSFHLAVVVDDIKMKITHIIRGEDHLTNTGLHLVLYESLGEKPPIFGHLPLVFSKEKDKLSKRAPESTISELRKKGFLAEAVVNYLISLGYHISLDEFTSMDRLFEKFDIQKVSKGSVIYDEEVLEGLNRKWLRKIPAEELLLRAKAEGFTCAEHFDEKVREWVKIWSENSGNLKELADNIQILFKKPAVKEKVIFEESRLEKAVKFIQTFVNKYNLKEKWLDELVKTGEYKGMKKAELFKAVRIFLTGKEHGPSISDLVRVLGDAEVKERLLKKWE